MADFIWRLRAALAYRRLAGLRFAEAWGMSEALLETFDGWDYSPTEAVREDLTYWGD